MNKEQVLTELRLPVIVVENGKLKELARDLNVSVVSARNALKYCTNDAPARRIRHMAIVCYGGIRTMRTVWDIAE